MAGHSHWARIKRAKAVTDARRGKAWSKLSRAIIVAARAGGGDPSMNLNLRYAIDAAKAENMPKDTIERAVKKGAGAGDGVDYQEMIFEGYGPGGAAIIATALTDNRNRTAPEIKKAFERRAGNLGATNSVAWMFSQRGVILVPVSAGEDKVTEIALSCGADDVRAVGDAFEVSCAPAAFEELRSGLAEADITPESAEISMVPNSTVSVTGDAAGSLMKLVEELEDHDDVQKVYTNFEIPEEEMARLAEG